MNHWLLLVTTLLVPGSDADILYPYGDAVGDAMGLAVDNGYNVLAMDEKIKFFTHSYDELYINTNGVLSFGTAFTENIPQEFPLVTDDAVAALFWADHDLSVGGGKLWFRASDDTDLMQRVENDIQPLFRDCVKDFSPSKVYVVTWENVTYQGVTKLDECLLSFDEEFCICAYVDGFSHEHCECMKVYNDTDFCKCYTVNHCIVYCECIMTYNDKFCECQFLNGSEKAPGECDCLRIYDGRTDICDCIDEYHNETYCECLAVYNANVCDCYIFDGNSPEFCRCRDSYKDRSVDFCKCVEETSLDNFCYCKEQGFGDKYCKCFDALNGEAPGLTDICTCFVETDDLDMCICNYTHGNWETCECLVTGHNLTECACYLKYKDWDFCDCFLPFVDVPADLVYFCRCIAEGHDENTCFCFNQWGDMELCECLRFKSFDYCECMSWDYSESFCECYITMTVKTDLCYCRELHGSGPFCECYLEFNDEDFCHCLINEQKFDLCECIYVDDYSSSFCTCMEEYNNFEICECWDREGNIEFCECFVDEADAEFCNCLTIHDLLFCNCMNTYSNETFCDCYEDRQSSDWCSCQIEYHDDNLCECFVQFGDIDFCRCYLEYEDETFCQCFVQYADVDLCHCYTQYLSVEVCMCLKNYSDPLFCQCLFLVNDLSYCQCFEAIVDCTFCECYISDYEPDFCDILISKQLDIDMKGEGEGRVFRSLFGESIHNQMKEAHATMKRVTASRKQQNILTDHDVQNVPHNKNTRTKGVRHYPLRYEKIMKQMKDRPADRQEWEERKSVRRRTDLKNDEDAVKNTMDGQMFSDRIKLEKRHRSGNEKNDYLGDMLRELGLKNEAIKTIPNGIKAGVYKELSTKTQSGVKNKIPSWKSDIKAKPQNMFQAKKKDNIIEDLTVNSKDQIVQTKAGILLHNTYQAVLITDGVTSFVMFNYDTITWLTGNSGGGVNGQGGTMASTGLNKRNGLLGYNHPYSMSTQLFDLVTDSNTGRPGRWIYLVSKNTRLLGPQCELLMG